MAAKSSKKGRKSGAPELIPARVAEMKEGILQMGSFMNEAAALAATEVRRIDEIRENLEATVARLEAEIGEKEELLREKESALIELGNKSLGQISDMENQLAKKDELLESRAAELKESWSQAQDTRPAELEAQLREKEEILSQKEAALTELQEASSAKIRNLENLVRKEAELLESREAEIADLRSKLDRPSVAPEGSVTLGEEDVVDPEELEQGMAQGAYPADAKVKVIEQSMRGVVIKPAKMAQREAAPDAKKSRLASLLAPIKKKN